MTEADFRIQYCELMEYYQLIEMRCRGICAAILADDKKGWYERLADYEKDPLGTLIKHINELQKQKQIPIFTRDDLLELARVRNSRNYWAHQCFAGNEPIIFSKGVVKRKHAVSQLRFDLQDAIEWDEKLADVAGELIHNTLTIGPVTDSNKEKSNIVLIGMPASGKSTVGIVLAKVLGMGFVDSDLIIQKKAGAKLSEIIEKYGVDSFMMQEETALLSIYAFNTVIATGGSAVYSEIAMNQLAKTSRIVYLKVGLDDLKERLSDIKGRGVVLREGETLETIYESRTKLYEKYADITVEENGFSIEDTVRAVVERI